MIDEFVLLIHSKEKDKYYNPAVLDGVVLEYHMTGAPGKIFFKVVKDEILSFSEGDEIIVKYKNKDIFRGYVFIKKRDKDGVISVTAYDQIRYLKNKDIHIFLHKKASEILKFWADTFKLKCGDIADTEYVIPKYRGSNTTLLDMIEAVLSMTTQNTKKIFVLFDDAGKLTLKELKDMEIPLLIDNETAQNFEYTSSIDKDTYNKIKLYFDDKKTGKRDVWIAENSADFKRWGILQYTKSINAKKPINFKQMTDTLLKLHDKVHRSLRIKSAFGDVRVRAGTLLYVNLDLGDMKLTKRMVVKTVQHRFSNALHTMDLEVIGGDFS